MSATTMLRNLDVLTASVALLGSACAIPPSADDQQTLVGTVWALHHIQMNDGQRLVANPPEHYTVEFMDDGSLAVRADCNWGRGSFTTPEPHRLSVQPIATTRAACPDGSIGDAFVRSLNNANSFFFEEGHLVIELMYDSGTMQFSAPGT